MYRALVTTTIKNTGNNARKINWTGDGAVWVDAGKSLTVPYEVWSKADRKQRAGIIADCGNGSIELTINVVNKDNESISIPFDPSTGADNKPKVTVSPATKNMPIQNDSAEQLNTVKASTPDSKKAAQQFGATTDNPEESFDTTPEGVSKQGFSVDDSGDIKSTKTALNEPQEASNEEQEDADTDNNAKALFDAAVADKRWDDALQVLTDTFGADKVTFTTRTIMTIKDWETIREKYNL